MDLLRVPSKKAALAFGLKWTVLDPFERFHQQVSRWRAEGYQEHARYSLSGDQIYGLVKDGFGEQEKQQVRGLRVLAAAACAAMHPKLKGQTAFVAIALPGSGADSTVAAIGLVRGMVVLDQLCRNGAQLSEARQSFARHAAVGSTEQEYPVYGNSGQVHHDLDLEGLVLPAGTLSQGPVIRPLRAKRGFKVAGLIAVPCLLAAVSVAALNSHRSDLQQRAQVALLERNKPEAKYREAIQALLQRPVVSLSAAIETMRDALADFPLVHAGWELTRITCPSSGDCSVQFKRLGGSGASLEEFRLNAAPHWRGISASGQDEVTFALKLDFPQSKLRREAWISSIAFRDRCFESWQFLEPGGWRAEVGNAAIQAVPAGTLQKDMASLYGLPDAVYAMPVVITNQAWWYAKADPDSPVRPSMLGESTVMEADGQIELTHSNKQITFSARGLTYVQR
ncbi:MAG: hypothetical protein HYX47_13350 [Burkholderiales bacterium]|nr:hypothetical protein [Burkholderiales bacterium]